MTLVPCNFPTTWGLCQACQFLPRPKQSRTVAAVPSAALLISGPVSNVFYQDGQALLMDRVFPQSHFLFMPCERNWWDVVRKCTELSNMVGLANFNVITVLEEIYRLIGSSRSVSSERGDACLYNQLSLADWLVEWRRLVTGYLLPTGQASGQMRAKISRFPSFSREGFWSEYKGGHWYAT